MIAGFFAMIGHSWPLYFGFRGGKGVATAIGIGLVTYPIFGAGALALGAAVMLLSRYVSLGSIVGVTGFAIAVAIRYGLWPVGAWAIALDALVLFRHCGNIGRLIHGTERKIGQKEQ